MRTATRLVLLLLIPSTLLGQSILRGTVVDSTSGSVMVGANVFIQGTALGGITDREGRYRVVGIPPGRYTVRISYIGYVMRRIDLVLPDGETTLDVQLLPDVIEGAEVLVTAQVRGQVAAINQQLTSNTIVNVISEEKIQELPDANAAEAIGRLPGVATLRSGGEANKVVLRGMSDRFSTVTIDGIKIAPTDENSRGVDLSTIAQGSLAGVELYKALTPDRDADAIAGSVNLATRKAPSSRMIRLDGKGHYNHLDKDAGQYEFSARYGERFFDDLLGVQVTGNLEQRIRSNEQLNLDYNTFRDGRGNDVDFELSNFTVSYTDEQRKRGGAGVLLDLNTPDSGSVRVNGIYSSTTRDYFFYTRDYPNGGPSVRYGGRDREQEINTFTGSLHGENYLIGLTARWGLSFAQSKGVFPYDQEILFIEPIDATVQSGMRNIPHEMRHGPAEAFVPYAYNNFSRAYAEWAYFRGEKNLDREKTAFLDLAKNYTLGSSLAGEVKVGGKYRSKNRFKERSETSSPYYLGYFWPYTRTADGSIVTKTLQGTPFASLSFYDPVLFSTFLDADPVRRDVYNQYTLYPLVNRDAFRLWYDLNKGGVQNANGSGLPEYARNREIDGDYYDVVERVSAGYLMNTLNIGEDITVIAGVRVEYENNDYISRYSPEPVSGFPMTGRLIDTTVSYSETVWLPNLQVTFRPLDFMNVRLAAYGALARPDFNQRLERLVARNASGVVLYVGNPKLKAARAANYEINTSFFSNTIGLISVSVFYKDVKHMFHLVDGVTTRGQSMLDSLGSSWGSVDPSRFPFQPNITYDLTYPLNSSKPTRVWGLEIEHQTNLNFLPGLLSNIVLSYNFSFVRSETYVPKSRVDTTYVQVLPPPFPPVPQYQTRLYDSREKLEGQPEFFGNVAVGYDIGGFSGRISMFHQGEFNRSFSASGRSDQVVDSYTRWDLSLRQRILDYLSVTLNVNNITNVKEGTSIINQTNGWNLVNTSERYGLTADLGVRIEF